MERKDLPYRVFQREYESFTIHHFKDEEAFFAYMEEGYLEFDRELYKRDEMFEDDEGDEGWYPIESSITNVYHDA